MRNRETRMFGLEKSIVDNASGGDAWPALLEFVEQQAYALPPLEAEARKREQIAVRRLAYWRRRVGGVISKADEKASFDFWQRRAGLTQADWQRQREEDVQRMSEYFDWADRTGHKGFPPPGVFRPGSYDHLLASWLVSHRELETAMASGQYARAVSLAFLLGELTEGFKWRFGADSETGKRREDLALGKRKSVATLPKAREKRRSAGYAPDWHIEALRLAEEIWKRNPRLRNNGSGTARLVHERMVPPRPAPRTIRQMLARLKKT